MEIIFESDERWDGDRGGVLFWAEADHVRVRCFVSRRAVHDSFGGSGTKDDVVSVFQQNRSAFETEAAALIRSGRVAAVERQPFKEAQILSGRVRHRPVTTHTRRVTSEELMAPGVAASADDLSWWCAASGQAAKNITIHHSGTALLYVEVAFDSETAASEFDYKMSRYGVRTFRIAPAG